MNCYECNKTLICGWKDLQGYILCSECASKEHLISTERFYCHYCDNQIDLTEDECYTDGNGRRYCCESHALMDHGYEYVFCYDAEKLAKELVDKADEISKR